jgi:excisionase family DNA binding protein
LLGKQVDNIINLLLFSSWLLFHKTSRQINQTVMESNPEKSRTILLERRCQMESNQLLKGKDIARLLNVSIALAYRLIENGEIKSIRFGRTVRVAPDALAAFLVDHQVGNHRLDSNHPDHPHF